MVWFWFLFWGAKGLECVWGFIFFFILVPRWQWAVGAAGLVLSRGRILALAEPLRRTMLEMELNSPSAAVARLREQERLSPPRAASRFFRSSQLVSGVSHQQQRFGCFFFFLYNMFDFLIVEVSF